MTTPPRPPAYPSPALRPWACENCGFWQRWFPPDPPPSCPVCLDVRNALPDEGWSFADPAALERRLAPRCWQPLPGVPLTAWGTAPRFGLDSVGWVLDDVGVSVEAAPYYHPASLAALQHVRVVAASHVHGYGALWQLAEAVQPEFVAVGVADLTWTKAFRVTWPVDDELALADGVTMHVTGGHFPGHAVVLDARHGLLFCGDALKVDLGPDGEPLALSAHKAFHAQLPLSRAELRHTREVLGALDFEHVATPFELGRGVGRRDVLALLDHLLALAPPSAGPVPLADLRRRR